MASLLPHAIRWQSVSPPLTFLCGCLLFLLANTACVHGADREVRTLSIGGATIEVTLPAGPLDATQEDLMDWVNRAATAVSTYYGRFPAKHLTLKISADDRDGVHHGVTYPEDGGLIVISVGRRTSKNDLESDWMLTHEMIHLAFPSMPRQQHWIEEGLSVYVEPVARVQAGQLAAQEMWYETVRDMHQGEPQSDDEGLDRTHTWGRTYWGGAMFCLVADVRIREETHNRVGLQDALRAILNHGGVITEDWEIERALRVGDEATGTKILVEMYHEMRDKPNPTDLAALWKKLGITVEGKTVKLDDAAPAAAIRDAITRKK
jgi:hypothetical protein